jgi:hypothetical protein
LAATVVLAGAALTATSLWFNLHLTAARNETERNRRLSETNRVAAEANAEARVVSVNVQQKGRVKGVWGLGLVWY